jgi:ferredoxin
MATLIVEDQVLEVADGDELKDPAEQLGVPIGCGEGMCGTCQVDVVEGMENLNDLTEAEEDFGLDDGQRLICQCVIESGVVKMTI